MAVLLLMCMVFSACDVLFMDLATKDPFEGGWDSTGDQGGGGSGGGSTPMATVIFDPGNISLPIPRESVTVPVNTTIHNSHMPLWYRDIADPYFLGWYTEADSTDEPFDSRIPVLKDMTVYAHWIEDTGQGSVEFNHNGGHQSSYPSRVPLDGDGKLARIPAPPERHGWIFYGWYTQEGGPTGGGDLVIHTTELDSSIDTLHAHWIAIPHAVTYDLAGGTGVYPLQVILEPDSNYEWRVSPPTVPTRTGYNFVHWARVNVKDDNSTGDRWDFPTEVVEDHLTLRAVWAPRVYQLRYHPNGGNPASSVEILNIQFDEPPAILAPNDSSLGFYHSNTSYGFLNWNSQQGGNQGTTRFYPGQSLALISRWGEEPLGHTYVLYAQWGEAGSAFSDVSVYFNLNGGSMASGDPHPAELDGRDPTQGIPKPPDDPQRTGYDFMGWYRIHNPDFPNTSVLNNQAWKFDNDPSPDAAGMNRTLFAGWKIREYSLSYDANAGTGETVTMPDPHANIAYDEGDVIKGLDDNARPGWRFLGWNTAANGSGQSIYPGQNMSALEAWGGSNTAPLVLFAQWETLTYTVSYYSTGGTAVAAAEGQSHGSILSAPGPVPERTGYTFDGWHTLNGTEDDEWGVQWVFGSADPQWAVTESFTLFARWEARLYTLHYDLNGGSGTVPASKVDIQYNTFVDLAPSDGIYKLGHVFTGWNTASDGSGIPFLGGQEQVRFRDHLTNQPFSTLYAQWAEVHQVTVEFDTLGGNHVPYRYVSEDGGITEPPEPSLVLFSFEGWYTDTSFETKFEFEKRDSAGELTNPGAFTKVEGNITLVALWLASSGDGRLTITFHANGGEFDDGSAKFTERRFLGQTVRAPDDPEKDPEEFNGWFHITGPVITEIIPHNDSRFTDNTPYDFNEVVRSDMNLYARWVNMAGYFGYGTVESPFLVRSVADLQLVGSGDPHPEYLSGPDWDLDSHYRQLNDLPENGSSMPPGDEYSPIGTSASSSFTGVYDGNGYTIKGLTISRAAPYAGLFGYIGSGGLVKDLGLEEVTILNTGAYTGALAGRNDGTITNSYANKGTVEGSSYVGGLVGYNGGSSSQGIKESYVILDEITATGGTVGGLAGFNDLGSLIENTYAAADIMSGTSPLGGLVGVNQGVVRYSYATAELDITGGTSNNGGLVGSNINGTLQNSVALSPRGKTSTTSIPFYRLGANSGGSLSNLFARNMAINDSFSYFGKQFADTTPTGQHGSSIVSVDAADWLSIEAHLGAMTEAWWASSTGLNFSISSSANGPSIWVYHGGNAASHRLPTLRNTGGSQNPKMLEISNLTDLLPQGEGTETSPFLVRNAEELQMVGGGTGNPSPAYRHWALDKHYRQTANITLPALVGSETSNFTPIGTSGAENTFTGSYNGDVYSISNLIINISGNNYVGLFGHISGATLRNITLVDVDVTGRLYVGSLVGYAAASPTIENCEASGKVTHYGTETSSATGGLVGCLLGGTIRNSHTNVTVTSQFNRVGGLVGVANTSTQGDILIINSSANGNVTGIDRVGGLVGENRNTNTQGASNPNIYGITIENSFAEGNVSGTNFVGGLIGGHYETPNLTARDPSLIYDIVLRNTYATGVVRGVDNVGGLAGNNRGQIYDSWAEGAVIATGDNVGGLVGYNDSRWSDEQNAALIRNSYAIGNVKGNQNVGGLVGSTILDTIADYPSLIERSYATGDVEGTSRVGGLAGYHSGEIRAAYASGSVKASGDYAGGLVGYHSRGRIENSYAIGDVTGDANVGGIAGYAFNGAIQYTYATGIVTGNDYIGGIVGNHGVASTTTQSSVALNPSISRIASSTSLNVRRVKGNNPSNAGLSFNFARGDMLVNGTPPSGTYTHTQQQGESIDQAKWTDRQWWVTATSANPRGPGFNGTGHANVWNFDNLGGTSRSLPTLNDMPGQTAHPQDPRIRD